MFAHKAATKMANALTRPDGHAKGHAKGHSHTHTHTHPSVSECEREGYTAEIPTLRFHVLRIC